MMVLGSMCHKFLPWPRRCLDAPAYHVPKVFYAFRPLTFYISSLTYSYSISNQIGGERW